MRVELPFMILGAFLAVWILLDTAGDLPPEPIHLSLQSVVTGG